MRILYSWIFIFALISCVVFAQDSNEDQIKADTSTSGNTLPPLLVAPHHYELECSVPTNTVVLVNQTHTAYLWPKNSHGENVTLEAAKITIIAKPLDIIKIQRVDAQNPNVLTVQFHITEAQNPCIIYFVENNEPVAPGLKFASIEEGNINSDRSSVISTETDIQVNQPFELDVILLDAYGKPTAGGTEHLKFISSVEDISVLNLNRLANREDDQPSQLRFSMNCSVLGEYYLNVTYRGRHLKGSPYHFNIVPGNMSHSTSRVMGYGSWIAATNEPNTIYVQILDELSHEIITIPTPTSQQFENGENEASESATEEDLTFIHNKITLKAWNSKRKPLETMDYVVEYIGKSTWGIRYVVQQDNPDTIFLGVYYEADSKPIGGLLSVYLQEAGFPYPPNSYKMLGPYPARPEISQTAPSAISTAPKNFRSYTLDKNGWLDGRYTPLFVSDTDYRAEFMGSFHVEEDGVFLFICLGAEHYTLDVPLLRSGDVWNIHQLSKGTHSLQVSTLAKRDWNFEFQCRFQPFNALKSYPSESLIPDIIEGQMAGDIQILLQNLHTHPITDIQAKVIAINDTTVSPRAYITQENLVLAPQEFTQVSIRLEFDVSEENHFTFPTQSFLAVVALFSPSLQAKTQVTLPIRVRHCTEPFQFIFTDRDQSKQSAVAIAPSASCERDNGCPVVVVAHGGGVSVTQLAGLYPSLPNAWFLFPRGRCVVPYELGPLFESHTLAAVEGLADFQSQNKISHLATLGVDRNSILAIGSHHYGGRGALMLANHNADRMLGVSADSGWIKHNEPRLDDFIHPMISGLLRWSLILDDFSYTTENFRSVPFFVGSGQGDSAGYPWRMFYQQTLLEKLRVEARVDNAVGISYKKHPTAAIEPTQSVLEFIQKRVSRPKQLTKDFSVSSANPGVFKGHGGVHISALWTPTTIATIDVKIQGSLWLLNTTNTRSFDLFEIDTIPRASQILIDGTHSFMIDTAEKVSFVQENGIWMEQKEFSFRKMNQYGPVTRLYEEKVSIVCGTHAEAEEVQMYQLFAVYIANELVKQHRSDVRIYSDIQYDALREDQKTNVILIGGTESNMVTKKIMKDTPVPIRFEDGDVVLADCRVSCARNTAALFLAPSGDHLAYVVAASSLSMMQSVTNILPLHTPYDSFPDFVLIDESHTWKGANGILSLGYWDATWSFNPLSSVHQCPTYIPSHENCTNLW